MVKIKKKVQFMVGFSYDDSGPDVFKKADQGFYKELRKARPIQHTYMKHSSSFPGINKFCFPTGRMSQGKYTAVMSKVLLNALKTQYAGLIPSVGNETYLSPLFNRFIDKYRPEREGKYFRLLDEGKELSLGDTIRLGASKNGITLFLCGDTPYLWDIGAVLGDSDIREKAVTMDLNCRELMFQGVDRSQYRENGFFQRNYHLILEDEGMLKAVKEPNIFALDCALVGDKINKFYEARKSSSGKGMMAFLEFIFGNQFGNEKFREGVRFFWDRPGLTLGTIAKMGLKRMLPKSKMETDSLKLHARLEDFQVLAEMAADGPPVKLKAQHTDPTRLMDFDSYQDGLWGLAVDEAAGDSRIYPYQEELDDICRWTPDLIKEGMVMLDPEYINWIFSEHETLKGKEPFDSKGNLVSTGWEGDPRIDQAVACLEERATAYLKEWAA